MRIPNIKATAAGALLAVLSQLMPGHGTAASDTEAVVLPRALAHAVMAMQETTGGKVIEVRLADEKGAPVFEAVLKKEDNLVYMRIESVSDDVTEIKVSNLPPWMLTYRLEAYMRSIDKAKVSLADAIVKAEEYAAAPAIGARIAKPLSGTNAVLAYYVETIKGEKRQLAAIDAENGAFISNPETLYEPRTPVKLVRRLAPS
jgi:uncharacterized membrane protein YkoI